MGRKHRRFGTLKELVEFSPLTKHEATVKEFIFLKYLSCAYGYRTLPKCAAGLYCEGPHLRPHTLGTPSP